MSFIEKYYITLLLPMSKSLKTIQVTCTHNTIFEKSYLYPLSLTLFYPADKLQNEFVDNKCINTL